MSDWNFLSSSCVTIGTFHSNAHYQFLQEKLFRFRVEFIVKMRKHTTWSSHWEFSVQGTHLMGVIQIQVFKHLSNLSGGSSTQQKPQLPGYRIILGFLSARDIFGEIFLVWKKWGGLNPRPQLGQPLDMCKRFKPGLQQVNRLYIMRYLQNKTLRVNNLVI